MRERAEYLEREIERQEISKRENARLMKKEADRLREIEKHRLFLENQRIEKIIYDEILRQRANTERIERGKSQSSTIRVDLDSISHEIQPKLTHKIIPSPITLGFQKMSPFRNTTPMVLTKMSPGLPPMKKLNPNKPLLEKHSSGLAHHSRTSLPIYFENFPQEITSANLYQMFNKFGKILDIYIPGKENKKGLRYGFAKFDEKLDQRIILQKINAIKLGKFQLTGKNAWLPEKQNFTHLKSFKNFLPSVRDSRKYSEVVLVGEGKSKVSEVAVQNITEQKKINSRCDFEVDIEIPDWLKKSVVGTMKNQKTLKFQQNIRYEENKFCTATPMGNDKILISFETNAEMENFLTKKDNLMKDQLSNYERWKIDHRPSERTTWILCHGIPLHAWSSSFFKRLCEEWGSLLEIDPETDTRAKLNYARLSINTQFRKIKEIKEVKINGIPYKIFIQEESEKQVMENPLISDEKPWNSEEDENYDTDLENNNDDLPPSNSKKCNKNSHAVSQVSDSVVDGGETEDDISNFDSDEVIISQNQSEVGGTTIASTEISNFKLAMKNGLLSEPMSQPVHLQPEGLDMQEAQFVEHVIDVGNVSCDVSSLHPPNQKKSFISPSPSISPSHPLLSDTNPIQTSTHKNLITHAVRDLKSREGDTLIDESLRLKESIESLGGNRFRKKQKMKKFCLKGEDVAHQLLRVENEIREGNRSRKGKGKVIKNFRRLSLETTESTEISSSSISIQKPPIDIRFKR